LEGPDTEETTLFFMLAHHGRGQLNRCLRVPLRGREVFLCARCTGILCGFLAQLSLLFTVLVINPVLGNCLLLILPLPSVADWVTQRLGYRESVNPLRVSTGILLGTDFAHRMARISENPLDPYVLLTSALYLLTVALITHRTR